MTIHQADSQERKRTVRLLGVLLVVALILALGLYRWLRQIEMMLAGGAQMEAKHQVVVMFTIFSSLLSISLLSLGYLSGKHALEVIKQQRFPSASAKLFRQMTVYQGERGVRLGQLNLLISIFLVLAAFLCFPYRDLMRVLGWGA